MKVRDYAFRQSAGPCKYNPLWPGNGSLQLSLSGLRLRGASFGLGCCTGCTLSDLALEYPTYNKHILEMEAPNTNCTRAAINNGHCPGRQKFGVGKLLLFLLLYRTGSEWGLIVKIRHAPLPPPFLGKDAFQLGSEQLTTTVFCFTP